MYWILLYKQRFLLSIVAILLLALGLDAISTSAQVTDSTVCNTARAPLANSFQPSPPYYSTFYYPWTANPATDGRWQYWEDHGNNPPATWFSHYLPDTQPGVFNPQEELYSSRNVDTLYWQFAKMREARLEVAISTWWGRGHKTDATFCFILKDLMNRTDNPYPNLRWSLYYELESIGDPSVDQLVSDLDYLAANYADQPGMLKIDGKPVLFVYSGPEDSATSGFHQRWAMANQRASRPFYIVLKLFSGYRDVQPQPDSWHQYGPASRIAAHEPYSYGVSPGFWLDDGSAPRLNRNLQDFEAGVINMVKSNAQWKLILTWNEWGEGTSVEPGTQVRYNAALGRDEPDPDAVPFGNAYIDILNKHLPPLDNGGAPVIQTAIPSSTPTATLTSTPTVVASNTPTLLPSSTPTLLPSSTPTLLPSSTPSLLPTSTATLQPSNTPIPTNTSVAPGTGTSITVPASADAYVHGSSVNNNYGTSSALRVDAWPEMRSYLRFDVPQLNGTVSRATIRVFSDTNSDIGYNLFSTGGGWTENEITFSNAPLPGMLLGQSGPINSSSWTAIDVTALVRSAGNYNVVMITTDTTATRLSSREGSNPPELVIEMTGDSSTGTQPTNIPTQTATSVPTQTATLLPTSTVTLAATATLVPTNTPEPVVPTATLVPTATSTLIPTNVPTNVPTATPTELVPLPPPGNLTTITLAPAADAYVYELNPDGNYRDNVALRTDGSPLMYSYLRFDIPPINGTVVGATLRVYAETTSYMGYNVHSVSGAWNESTITYRNAPAFGSAITTSGVGYSGTWLEANVLSIVTGVSQANVALTTDDTMATRYSSREGSNPPQLVLIVDSSLTNSNTVQDNSTMGFGTNQMIIQPTSTPTLLPTIVVPSATATDLPTETLMPTLSEPTSMLTPVPTEILPTASPTVEVQPVMSTATPEIPVPEETAQAAP